MEEEMILFLIELVTIYLIGLPVALIIARWMYRRQVKRGRVYYQLELTPEYIWAALWGYDDNPKVFYSLAVFWPFTIFGMFVLWGFLAIAFDVREEESEESKF